MIASDTNHGPRLAVLTATLALASYLQTDINGCIILTTNRINNNVQAGSLNQHTDS